MRKLLIAVLAVLGVLLAAVLVLPAVIDWNSHKGMIAARISAATGRAVSLDGDISLSLFPTPQVSVAGARLANPPGFALPDMAALKRLDVTVALMPLLGGRVQVESLTFIEPLFVFETAKTGAFNWEFDGDRPAPDGSDTGTGGRFVPMVSFDEVTIEKGTVLYRDDRTGKEEKAEALDARVVAASLAGPFQMHGTFRLRGVPVRGEVTTGRFTEGAAVPVRAALTFPETETTLRFAGIAAAAPGGGTRAQGDLRAEGANLATALAPFGADARVMQRLGQPFSLRAAVEGAGDLLAFNGLEMQVGDMRASGSASLDTGDHPRAKLALTLNRLDLDAWLSGNGKSSTVQPPAAQPSRGRPAQTAEPPRTAGGFELPKGMSAQADIVAEAVTFNGALVRQARLEASLADGVVTIERVAALLPGGSDVVAGGTLSTSAGQPVLDLRLEASADNLRGVLEWLKQDVKAIPPDRLRKASFGARIQGRPGRVDVTGIDLRVDTSHVTGGVAYVDRGRPAYGVRLDIDRLNLDAYLPAPADAPATAPAAGGTARGGTAPGPLDELRRVDVNLQLNAGNLTYRGMTAQGLALDATAAGGVVVLRDVKVADLAGMSGQASGRIGRLSPLGQADLSVNAEAPSLAGLARHVAWPAGAPTPERLGPVTLRGRFAGDLDRLTLDVELGAAGGNLTAGGTLASLSGTPQADIKLRTTHPELGALLSLLNPATAPASYGAVDLYGELRGGAAALSVKGLQGTVAGTSVTGEGGYRSEAGRPRVELDLQTGDIDLDRLAAPPPATRPEPARGGNTARPAPAPPAAGGETFDLSWLSAFDGRLGLTSSAVAGGGLRLENPALRATLSGGVLTLEQLDGGLLGGQVGATGRLAAPADGVPQAQLDLTVVKAKPGTLAGDRTLGISGGTIDLDAELSAFGRSSQAMLQSLSGQGRLAARDGSVRGFDMAALAQRLTARLERPQDAIQALARALQGGDTSFGSLDGSFTVERGVVRSDDLALTAPLGDAAAAGQIDLPAGTVNAQVRVQVRADDAVPPLTLRLTGPLDKPTRSFDLKEVQAFIARRAAEGALDRVAPGLPVPGDKAQGIIRDLLEGLRR
ncbi:AsmA family protein [Azospirillum sp. RWY-5-1]|uniref:AsmA family protein n=1 Tax=Azospirillum oleiclasticum TaxID=2735135 RepID=A0ABX2TA62_9PROT|nr:AsmA family protein [Azospirillum oleiclasticum]NYZ12404.1 AsmA family protein [Azospirillum oleiclasticum]NYZ19565.1 AsmA family protein [Azospirillum oleiclasticum]